MKKSTVEKETPQIKKPSSAQFKKPSCALYKARVATVLRKAFQLSELCGVELRIIWFDREGNLVKTTPDNEEAKVRAMAERFSMLSEHERNKKSTNLSGFLNKKMMDDKRESLKKKDNKFSGKVSEFMDSLRSRFQLFQESLHLLDQQQPKETNCRVSPSTTTTSLSEFSILDQESVHLDQQQPKETTSGVVPTDLSSNLPSKFSILLYNHDNSALTELANNSSGFDQSSSFNQDYGSSSNYLDLLLGEEQGMMTMTGCNNFDIPLPFSNTFHQFDHDHQFMQQTQQPVYHYAVE